MTTEFRHRIREAIANHKLQTALDRNADRRMEAWEESFSFLPDAEELRRKAFLIRRETIENLDHYIELFCRRVEANGICVHRAVDAEEANRIVVNIAKRRDARLIAKSKSMLSEEIGLNQALTQTDIRVVETDLGEFIVQLRGEPPAHIVTPAVHLLREDVATTFERELGMPYSTDVEEMTKVARRKLREVFLTADIGISGVNFGVAESGTLCLVTNEGNGRMVTMVPPVHIALMGAERIVPSVEDLGLMLQLLPSSSTGQKITSYVSLIHSPRREGDPDGPDERHLILVDNGRLELAGTWLKEALYCIRCGACLNVCPIFREIGGHAYDSPYSGPIGSVISPGLFGISDYGYLAKATTLCGACKEVCPVKLDLPKLLSRIRHTYASTLPRSPVEHRAMGIYTWFAEAPGRFRAAQRFASWGSRLLPRRDRWLRRLPPPVSAWTRSRFFPPFAMHPFRARLKDLSLSPQDTVPSKTSIVMDQPVAYTAPLENLVVRFREELEKLGGTFISCEKAQLPDRLIEQLRQLEVCSLITWGHQEPILYPVLRRLKSEEFELLEPELPRGSLTQRGVHLATLANADAGLTGAMAGFAATGTVIVPSGRNRSQMASLLPPVHFVLISVRDIYSSMTDWLAMNGEADHSEWPVLALVSGPSRTADIEMTLTIGVHGPERVIVICVE